MAVSLELAQSAVFLAPLSGYTDLPFRRACRRHGCEYAFTPLVDAGALVHGNPRNDRLLARGPEEPWLGTQLLGASPEILVAAAERLRDRDFEVLDLNLGCPVPKVTRRGAGAALGSSAELSARCAAALVATWPKQVTAKIRVLSAEDPAPTVRLAQALEDSGIAALTIHGREWQRMYSGPVAWDVIRAVAETLSIPVIANGGVFGEASAGELRRRTGCEALMVARGAIGNPWIFRELAEPGVAPPTHEEVCLELEAHVLGIVALYGESIGMRVARKIILAYLTGRGYSAERRRDVTTLSSLLDFAGFLGRVKREGRSSRYRATPR